MKVELELSQVVEEKIVATIKAALNESLGTNSQSNNLLSGEWLNLKEAAKYAGVSYNTLIKYREMGLEFFEVDGVKRVSKKAINEFYQKHMY